MALVKRGASLEIKDANGRTALVLCARERGQAATARILIDAGADVNAIDKFGSDALELAAWRGKAEFIDQLLEKGARVPESWQKWVAALFQAASQGLTTPFGRLIVAVEVGRRSDSRVDVSRPPLRGFPEFRRRRRAARHPYGDRDEAEAKRGRERAEAESSRCFPDSAGRLGHAVNLGAHPANRRRTLSLHVDGEDRCRASLHLLSLVHRDLSDVPFTGSRTTIM
jgi:ankyrin repeat protein